MHEFLLLAATGCVKYDAFSQKMAMEILQRSLKMCHNSKWLHYITL